MMNIINVTKEDQLNNLYKQSALTFEGLSVDTEEERQQVIDWLLENNVNVDNLTFNVIKGKLMNDVYCLTGRNRYPARLSIVSLTGIDTSKLVVARMRVGGRWFDDIVDNNLAREEIK